MKQIGNCQHISLSIPLECGEKHFDTITIIVTHNRKEMLSKCICSIINQSVKSDILIVDNASTDGTQEKISTDPTIKNKRIHYIRLNRNTGGAGGFHYGLKYAYEKGWEWFWLMDDDAEPDQFALENMINYATDENNIYGSTAVHNIGGSIKLCFPAKLIIGSKIEIIENHDDLSDKQPVAWLPFLGFFIHRKVITKIGFPDKRLFIRNDDIEYAERARINGIKMFLIKKSILEHPYQPTVSFNFLRRKLYYRSMPPWKMYYEVRNKIIIAKRYYSFLQGIKSFLGVSFQMILSVFYEKEKKLFLSAYFHGIIDSTDISN